MTLGCSDIYRPDIEQEPQMSSVTSQDLTRAIKIFTRVCINTTSSVGQRPPGTITSKEDLPFLRWRSIEKVKKAFQNAMTAVMLNYKFALSANRTL